MSSSIARHHAEWLSLLDLNHERYEEEVRAGLHGKKKGSGRKSKVDERQMELL